MSSLLLHGCYLIFFLMHICLVAWFWMCIHFPFMLYIKKMSSLDIPGFWTYQSLYFVSYLSSSWTEACSSLQSRDHKLAHYGHNWPMDIFVMKYLNLKKNSLCLKIVRFYLQVQILLLLKKKSHVWKHWAQFMHVRNELDMANVCSFQDARGLFCHDRHTPFYCVYFFKESNIISWFGAHALSQMAQLRTLVLPTS